jgi:hypothetical protein
MFPSGRSWVSRDGFGALLAWLDGTSQLTREQLIEDCADLFVATGEAAVQLARRRA